MKLRESRERTFQGAEGREERGSAANNSRVIRGSFQHRETASGTARSSQPAS